MPWSCSTEAAWATAAVRGECQALAHIAAGGWDVDHVLSFNTPSGVAHRTTALLAALDHGHERAVSVLLECGANPDAANSNGMTPLMHASGKGNLPLLQLILENTTDINASFPASGSRTGFHIACASNHADCVEALVRGGCDTKLRCCGGMSGRDLAEAGRCTAVLARLRALVMARAARFDPCPSGNRKVVESWTAQDILAVVRSGDSGGVERLIDTSVEAVDALIPDVVMGREIHTTALLEAVRSRQNAVAHMLLGRGAAPDLADSDGTTPLMVAAAGGHLDILEQLLSRLAPAGIDARRLISGSTAFHTACAHGEGASHFAVYWNVLCVLD